MGRKNKTPVTQAIRHLRREKATFEPHLYRYEERGGTEVSSRELGVDEHIVIKTLVMQDDLGHPLIILMHGDREVATGMLADAIGAKSVGPCLADVAEKHSGYQVGGTSPFGLRNEVPIYAQQTIRELEELFINGGKRGFLVKLSGAELDRVLEPTWVDAAQPVGYD